MDTSNNDIMKGVIKEVLEKYPDKVKEYKAGRHGLLGFFLGTVLKEHTEEADPKYVCKLLVKELKNNK